MHATQRDALLTLLLTPGLGPTLINRGIDTLGSAEKLLHATPDQLAGIQGIAPKSAAKLRGAIDEVGKSDVVAREIMAVEQANATLLDRSDVNYPALLKHIPDPPPLLWVQGELEPGDGLALAIVGSRKCSHYGREQADRFAYHCAQAGLCIVSGGAYGIDSAAHQAALRAGGRTVAVLGSGLAKPYPAAHVKLFERIAEPGQHRGALISELPINTPPAAENFPRRNRIISGLALGTLVVEAAARSGALITARLCVEEHGRELMALPGRVDSASSQGCHKMIREGWASLVTDATDVLDTLGEAGRLLKAQLENQHVDASKQSEPGRDSGSLFEHNLNEAQQRIVDALTEPCSLDQLTRHTGLPLPRIQAELTVLEIRGALRRQAGLITRRR